MQYEEILGRFTALRDRLKDQVRIVFCKCDITDGATEGDLDALRERLGRPIDPSLKAIWQRSSSVDFEWEVQNAGCLAAGVDTRTAPSGHFRLLTPAESEAERSFLCALGGEESMARLVPFSKLRPSGELLVVDHDSPDGIVELVILNSDLTRIVLAPSLDHWLNQRIATYFEDSSLQALGEMDPFVERTLEKLAANEFSWPPQRTGW